MKKLILPLIFILSLNFVVGLPNLVLEYDENQTIFVDKEMQIPLLLKNNGAGDMFNITFEDLSDSGYFTFPKVPLLQENKNTTINFTVLIDTELDSIIQIKAKYLFISSEYTPSTHYINITSDEFLPETVVIGNQDSVIWRNQDTTNRTIAELFDSFTETFTVDPDQETEPFILPGIGNYTYYDPIMAETEESPVGYIQVTQVEEVTYTHSPSLDKTIMFDIFSLYQDTTLHVDVYNDFMSIYPGDEDEGLFEIRNVGDSELVNLFFEVQNDDYEDWIEFATNNFNIDEDRTKVVGYTVSPKVNRTEETNISYKIKIDISGDNVNTITKQINVFVEYRDFGTIVLGDTCVQYNPLGVTDTIAYCLEKPNDGNCKQLVYFCDYYPNYGQCPEIYKEREKVIVVPGEKNVSNEDLFEMVESVKELDDIMLRVENREATVYTDIEDIKLTQTQLVNRVSDWEKEVRNIEKEEQERIRKEKTSNILGWIFKIFLGMVIGGFFLMKFIVARAVEIEEVRLPPE